MRNTNWGERWKDALDNNACTRYIHCHRVTVVYLSSQIGILARCLPALYLLTSRLLTLVAA
jgi:hypothetical protein